MIRSDTEGFCGTSSRRGWRGTGEAKAIVRGANGIAGFGCMRRSRSGRARLCFVGGARGEARVKEPHLQIVAAEQIEVFRQYAMVVGNGIFMPWDEDPREWAPQNHAVRSEHGVRRLEFGRAAGYSRGRGIDDRSFGVCESRRGGVCLHVRGGELPRTSERFHDGLDTRAEPRYDSPWRGNDRAAGSGRRTGSCCGPWRCAAG